MKWWVRGAAALAVLAALALGVLLWSLPRLAKSDAARARIEELARTSLGRELHYGEIDFGLLPPSLVVTEPTLAGATPDAPPLARADRVSLRVELLPLLRRRLEVSSLVVDGLALHLVRGDEGIVLPRAEGASPSPPPAPSSAAPAAGADGGEGAPLGSRSIRLRGASLDLEDRTVSPPASWRLDEIELTARGARGDAPVSLDGSLRLSEGGELELGGTASPDGALDLLLTLRDASIAVARPYVDAERLAGRLGGTVRVGGVRESPRLEAQLELEDADLALAGATVRGAITLEADVTDALAKATGPFVLEASDADVRYGQDFTKPPGTRARLRGQLITDARGALGADDLALELRNAVLTGEVRTGAAPALRVKAEPFALDGWEELVPPLGLASPSGRIAISKLEMGSDPEATRGLFVLDALQLTLPERAPIALTGEVAWTGGTLRMRDARLVAAGQPFTVSGSLEQIRTAPRYELSFQTRGADSNALLAGFAGQPDRLQGPLDAQGALRGKLSGDTPLLQALEGEIRFEIAGGRIVGTSLLEAVLGSFGAQLGEAMRQRDPARWERFTSEKFELLDGSLRIARGTVVSQPVQIRYRDYGARLDGPIRLEDLGLDLQGTFEVAEALDAELARAFGAKEGYTPQRRTIPLASVQGTLVAPKVRIASAAVADLAASYVAVAQREELRRRVEKELGEGAGDAVDQGLDVLQGLLRGGSKR